MRTILPFTLMLLAGPASASTFTDSCAVSAATLYGQTEPWVGVYCTCVETSLDEMGLMNVITGDGGSPNQQALADRAFEMCEGIANDELLMRASRKVHGVD